MQDRGQEAGKDFLVYSDRIEYAKGAIQHLKDCGYEEELTADGGVKLIGRLATAFLSLGESLDTIGPNLLKFGVHDNTIAFEARQRIGSWLLEGFDNNVLRLVEIAVGTNTQVQGENPLSHAFDDFLRIVEQVGVKPEDLKVIYIRADYKEREERNRRRLDPVPQDVFEQYSNEGGGLTDEEIGLLRGQGLEIEVVDNNHDDNEGFFREVEAAFLKLYSPEGTLTGEH